LTNEYQNYWAAYTEHFKDYFSKQKIRPHCHPRILEHESKVENSIVLIHGLTDSPYFMTALADHFHQTLGYNVYMPLLHCHGLKEPAGMESVSLDEWKKNVKFAIDQATHTSARVSIGGLSTGGTLSYYFAETDSNVNGDLYLFSAALDLAGKSLLPGNVIEIALRNADTETINKLEDLFATFSNVKSKARRLTSFIRKNTQPDKSEQKDILIGENPYRYDAIDLEGAKQLALLIGETDKITDKLTQATPFKKRVFIAHSYADTTANIRGVKELEKHCINPVTDYFKEDEVKVKISEKETRAVKHAEVVLNKTIPLTPHEDSEFANPAFDEMLKKITHFARNNSAYA